MNIRYFIHAVNGTLSVSQKNPINDTVGINLMNGFVEILGEFFNPLPASRLNRLGFLVLILAVVGIFNLPGVLLE